MSQKEYSPGQTQHSHHVLLIDSQLNRTLQPQQQQQHQQPEADESSALFMDMSIEVAKELTAATVGGITASVVGHPLDTVKVKLQTQFRHKTLQQSTTATTATGSSIVQSSFETFNRSAIPPHSSATSTSTAAAAASVAPAEFRSGLHCFTSVLRNEGIGALYRGLKPPLYACVFYNALTFGSLGYFKRLLAGGTHMEPSVMQNAMAGALTGICLSVIQTPVDQIKTQLQIQSSMKSSGGVGVPLFKGPSDLMKHIYRNECNGSLNAFRKTLMRAFPASFTREFYGSAIYFGTYAYLKQYLSKCWVEPGSSSCRKLGAYDYMISGALSGFTYWACVYPIDVVKSRMHIYPSGTYSGTMDGIRTIWRQEGPRALFFGVQTTILRSLCTSGVMFVCYEKTLEYLGRTRSK